MGGAEIPQAPRLAEKSMAGKTRALAGCFLALLSICPAAAQSPEKIQALVRRMTLEEKISLLHGARDPKELGQAGYWPGLPRLGIPPLRLADGPAGINVNQDATGIPAPVGLAATFNVTAARLFGVVMGRDAKALQQDIVLAPHINIVRDPLFRRNHTTFGEDPWLNAQLGAAEVAGIESQGVMAQVKHFAAYNGSDSVVIDERTLHEMYLPPFEAAVKAGAASVMCAYNRINGRSACENADLENGVLRGQWSFTGFVTSDWGAVRSPLALADGADLEMPGREIAGRAGGPYFGGALEAAVESGAIPVSAIDQALTRILAQMDRFHLLDTKPPARPAIDIEADAKIVREIAEQGAVLLKNEGRALPLTAADLASLAVIGPTGGQVAAGFMGERAAGFAARLIGPLAALRQSAPRARVVYSVGGDLTGVAIPGTALSHDGRPGLPRRQTTPDTGATQVDGTLDFHGPTALAPGTEYAWSGTLTAPEEGDYTFAAQAANGIGSITVDGQPLGRAGGFGFAGGGAAVKKWSSIVPTTDGRDNPRATVHLAAGAHRIELTASSTGTAALSIRFAWMTPEIRRANLEAAVAAARAARTAVVFAWSGMGGALALPENQDEVIRRVAAANPRTIVVLNTGGPLAIPWKDGVRAILEMWYPGQEGGWATADLLLGRANPGGKLPVTFPVRIEDAPARAAGHPERMAPSAATYSEGIAVGYRWYDQQGIQPLFPFGHGLSYTQFAYSQLAVKRRGDGVDVTFRLRNAGSRRGAEVVQAYLGPPAGGPEGFAPKSLAGFVRIDLAPGQSRRVAIHIGARALSYWSTVTHDWAMAEGSREVYVGSSSRDIRLRGAI
jgi:beta-glucosidase